jgi:thiamine-phosphate pyrophosphorylase
MKIVFPRLYAILSADLITTSEVMLAESLAEAGVAFIQYRDKNATSRALFEASSRISHALAAPHNENHRVRFILNDRPDVALLSGAAGVHVGQEDLPVEAARAICAPSGVSDFWVGVSTHNPEQVRAAAATSADYIAIGPIFATTTKKQPDPIVGTDFIRRARELTNKPLVAIGGITVERVDEVFRARADCIAVASDLICAPDPAARAREYLAIADEFAA